MTRINMSIETENFLEKLGFGENHTKMKEFDDLNLKHAIKHGKVSADSTR